jgi:hypothetical protein
MNDVAERVKMVVVERLGVDASRVADNASSAFGVIRD